jgi:hypothetical protein
MAGSWGCPHEINGLCHQVNGLTCDSGMKGCVLYGRYVFASAGKNERILQKHARKNNIAAPLVSKAENDRKER